MYKLTRLLHNPLRSFILIFSAALLMTGCDDISGTTGVNDEPVLEAAAKASPNGTAQKSARARKAEIGQGLAVFRRATARYHRVEAAVADGFEQILPCLSNPNGEGAIGIPYARLDRFDATIDLSEPEILFYEPQSDGTLKLVGGEPVVPIAAWPEEQPPSLFGREFHTNQEHGLYGLHMWIWRNNPNGVFAFWNANVSCEFDE